MKILKMNNMNAMRSLTAEKPKKEIYDLCKIAVAILLTAIMMGIFFGMAINKDGFYNSDSPIHIKGGIDFDGYGLETIIIKFFSLFATYPFLQFLFALYETIIVMLSWIMTQKLIEELFDINQWLILLISTSLILLSAIYIPKYYPWFYRYSLGTQPWHNSTYLGMRLGSIIYLYYLFKALPRYLDRINRCDWLGMSLSLMMSTMFKPNFFLTVVLSLSIILLFDLFTNHSAKSFKQIVKMGATLFPSFIVLIIQFLLIYITGSSSGSSKISVVWFSNLLWEGSAAHMIIKFARHLIFPIFIVILEILTKRKDEKSNSRNLVFSILIYLTSIIILSVFKETGEREYHGNFGWQICTGYYCMLMYLVPHFIYRRKSFITYDIEGKTNYFFRRLIYLFGTVFLILTLISSIIYFIYVSTGASYYI